MDKGPGARINKPSFIVLTAVLPGRKICLGLGLQSDIKEFISDNSKYVLFFCGCFVCCKLRHLKQFYCPRNVFYVQDVLFKNSYFSA